MFRLLKSIVVVLAAVVILFEEWLWDPLKQLMLAFSRLPLIRQLSGIISRLSPRASLLLYLAPMVLLFPFKILGLWLIGNGRVALGFITFLAAKILGTAIFAWLFSLTKNSLMSIAWFAKTYETVTRISQAAHAWVHRQHLFRWLQVMVRRIRAVIVRLDPRRI